MKITTIEQELAVKMQEKIDFNTFKLMTAIFTESKRRIILLMILPTFNTH